MIATWRRFSWLSITAPYREYVAFVRLCRGLRLEAQCHERAYSGAEEGAEMIQANYNERAFQLEELENEARQEYQAALMERGGN